VVIIKNVTACILDASRFFMIFYRGQNVKDHDGAGDGEAGRVCDGGF